MRHWRAIKTQRRNCSPLLLYTSEQRTPVGTWNKRYFCPLSVFIISASLRPPTCKSPRSPLERIWQALSAGRSVPGLQGTEWRQRQPPERQPFYAELTTKTPARKQSCSLQWQLHTSRIKFDSCALSPQLFQPFFSFPVRSHSINASRKWNRFSACESTGYLNGRRLEVDSLRLGCNNFPRRCVYINRNISGSLDGCKRCRLCHGILRERAREPPRKEKRLRFVIIADLNASRQRPPTRCFG